MRVYWLESENEWIEPDFYPKVWGVWIARCVGVKLGDSADQSINRSIAISRSLYSRVKFLDMGKFEGKTDWQFDSLLPKQIFHFDISLPREAFTDSSLRTSWKGHARETLVLTDRHCFAAQLRKECSLHPLAWMGQQWREDRRFKCNDISAVMFEKKVGLALLTTSSRSAGTRPGRDCVVWQINFRRTRLDYLDWG